MKSSFLLICVVLFCSSANAQDKGEPCGARLIRSKPSALLIVKSETLKRCVPAQTDASVEDASIRVGRFNRLQATIEVRNLNSSKTIKAIEWRLDIYDEQRKALHDTLYPAEEKTIKPGEAGGVSRSLSIAGDAKHVLPSFAVILVQISKITYQDGSTYKPAVECKANESYDDAACMQRDGASK